MGPTALLPFQRKSYSGFLRSEKIHRPWPGLNLRTSDPEASMITSGPLGLTTAIIAVVQYVRRLVQQDAVDDIRRLPDVWRRVLHVGADYF